MFDARNYSEWVYEPPRWRTVLVLGRPMRLFWPHLLFYKMQDPTWRYPLNAYALTSPVASEGTLIEKLCYFPFTAFLGRGRLLIGDVENLSHIDAYGRVCFDENALNSIREGNAVDVFWNSGFSRFNPETLRAWRAASEADVVALMPFPRSHLELETALKYITSLPYGRAPWLPGEPRRDDALVSQAQDAPARGPDVAHGGPTVDPQGGALE